MRLSVKPLNANLVEAIIDTNSRATPASLICNYCSQLGVNYNQDFCIYDKKKKKLKQFSTLEHHGVKSGDEVFIGYEADAMKWYRDWPLIIAVATAVLGALAVITLFLLYGLTGGKYPDSFGVVLDAGSTKTKAYVYKWPGNKVGGTGKVSQEGTCTVLGGIAEKDPMELGEVIECSKNVTKIVSEPERSQTPLYFTATAGMRLLNETNPTRVNKILEQVGLGLNETGLEVKKVEIISGLEEGIYAWIGSNFLKNTLEKPQTFDPWKPSTYGSLDMGGASVQIAYAVAEPYPADKIANINLYSHTYHLFSHSNLCFGRDEAERRHRYFLIQDLNENKIEDPCLPKGFSISIDASEFFNRPCTQSQRFTPSEIKDVLSQEKIFTFVGSSNPKDCKSMVALLLDDIMCRNQNFKDCFEKVNDIPEDQEFLAFATYFYTADFLKITNSNMEQYLAGVDSYCAKDIEQVMQISNDKHSTEYCFNGKYIYEVLTKGFNFKNTTWKNIQFVGKIQRKDLGWTLGYMINATNIIPDKLPTPTLVSAYALTMFTILFGILIVTSVYFLCKYNRRQDVRNYDEEL